MACYLYHVRRKLWSDEARRGRLVVDNALTNHRSGRRLAGAMGGMRKFTSVFHIVGPGDRITLPRVTQDISLEEIRL